MGIEFEKGVYKMRERQTRQMKTKAEHRKPKRKIRT